MGVKRISRHTWLFSFTDIAFLLLLVYTQLAHMNTSDNPVAEMRLPMPTVAKSPELTILKRNQNYNQLLVDKHSDRPYVLTYVVSGSETSRSEAMNFDELSSRLQVIHRQKKLLPRPVVVPLPESMSSDLLQAAALVGKYWSEPSSAAVHIDRSEGKP